MKQKNEWKLVRIKADLYEQLSKKAIQEKRSVANMLEVIIAKALKK